MEELMRGLALLAVAFVMALVLVGFVNLVGPAYATPAHDHEARQAKALESIAASLKKMEKCR
jgi:hypothetical protein